MNISVQSWQDLNVAMPIDPRSIILNTQLGAVQGAFVRSTNLLQASWGTNTIIYNATGNSLATLDGTDATTSTYAAQWNATHQMVNIGANLPSSLNKIAFMKAGPYWDNQLNINFGVTNWANVQLTFRDNIATSGQFLNGSSGSIPAYSFGNNITGVQLLHVTIAQPGIYSVVITVFGASAWSMFEMEWIVLP